VTGAASGIGRAGGARPRTRRLRPSRSTTARAKGKPRRSRAKAGRSGVRAILCPCDVADEAGVRAMLKTVGDQFGRLDVLINNAGNHRGMEAQGPGEHLARGLGPRFRGERARPVQVTRAAVPLLRVSRGCIVNTASIVGLRPGPHTAALRGEQGRGRQSDQDARLQSRTGHPRSMRWLRAGWKASGCGACCRTSTRISWPSARRRRP